jgi:hypothetical protein
MPHSPFTTAYLTRLELWNVGLQLPTPTIVTQRRAPHRSDATLSLCHNNFLIPIDSVLGYEGRIVYSTYVESKTHGPIKIVHNYCGWVGASTHPFRYTPH